MGEIKLDKELQEFRDLMQVPDTFEDGFRWSSLAGALFIGLLMVPGSMYMGLLAGSGIGPAAQWVTVILFIEVAKRAHRELRRAEIFVLFFMAGAAMGAPFSGLLWNQFFVNSDAAVRSGIAGELPEWFAPSPDSPSYAMRTFFHRDWLPVIGMVIFGTFFSELKNTILGYGLFSLASDIEKLPFPMAPIGAQGICALAEDADQKRADGAQTSWRWRVFAIGGALGLAFSTVYLLLPSLSGALTGQPVQIFPIPFADFTTKTQSYLPAVATGLSWDLGSLLVGMVIPFWAMVGSFVGLIFTFVANPLLYQYNVLHSWQPGDGTVATLYNNYIDFYFSFSIGIAIAVCLAGFWQVYSTLKGVRQEVAKTLSEPSRASRRSKERGDMPYWIVVVCYFFVTITYILVSGWLINWHSGVMKVLLLLGFVYTPLISYVTARLEGIAGQVVEIPMIREACLIASGYKGVEVWFLPLPLANYGAMTVHYRTCELVGTKFTSMWKTQVLLYPIILLSSILFANFIWSMAPIPSAVYPNAQMMWELQANMQCVTFTSTMGEYSLFEDAFRWSYLFYGAGFGVLLFGLLNGFGAPLFLTYGVVRGLGQSMPHYLIPQMIGALLGQYYFRRRFGKEWRQYIPVLTAGFFCGTGLVAALGAGFTFLQKAVVQLPF